MCVQNINFGLFVLDAIYTYTYLYVSHRPVIIHVNQQGSRRYLRLRQLGYRRTLTRQPTQGPVHMQHQVTLQCDCLHTNTRSRRRIKKSPRQQRRALTDIMCRVINPRTQPTGAAGAGACAWRPWSKRHTLEDTNTVSSSQMMTLAALLCFKLIIFSFSVTTRRPGERTVHSNTYGCFYYVHVFDTRANASKIQIIRNVANAYMY